MLTRTRIGWGAFPLDDAHHYNNVIGQWSGYSKCGSMIDPPEERATDIVISNRLDSPEQ